MHYEFFLLYVSETLDCCYGLGRILPYSLVVRQMRL